MATFTKSPIGAKSNIKIPPTPDLPAEKPRPGKTITVGPLPVTPAHVN